MVGSFLGDDGNGIRKREAVADPITSDPPVAEPPADNSAENAIPASNWRTIGLRDEFGDVAGRAAISESVGPIRRMEFPYGNMTGRVFVDCDNVWFRFSEQPNLTNTAPQTGGYSTFSLRYMADGDRNGSWFARQQWGGNDISLVGRNNGNAVSVISSASELAIVLSWYGSGNVVFRWDLTGSTDAIRESCN